MKRWEFVSKVKTSTRANKLQVLSPSFHRDATINRRRDLQGCRLAFKKTKSSEFGLFETVCHLLWLFLKVEEVKGLFWKNLSKNYHIFKIPKIVLVILPKFHQKFVLFSFLRILSFLKLLMVTFVLFVFFGPGNPGVTVNRIEDLSLFFLLLKFYPYLWI